MDSWERIDAAPAADAAAMLRDCCGSSAWVDRMLARRPFGSQARLRQSAREAWFALTPADWKEAFAAHPRIGDDPAAREQAGVRGAPARVLEALADGNRRYEQRFGYIFIVSATGKSAEQMLALLRQRLEHDPDVEIRIAAEEQAKITEQRLLRK